MPRKGYKSITVTDKVYDYFYKEYVKVKDEYAIKKGVRSFSAYMTYRLSELFEIKPNIPHFLMLNHDAKGVKIQDTEMKRVADVEFSPKGIYCPLCDASNCEHIRFALEQKDIKELVKKHKKEGWNL